MRQGLALGTTLHFEFYQEAVAQDAGLRVVHLPRMDTYPESEHEIMHRLVQRYTVPEKLRCDPFVTRLQGLHAGLTCMLCSGMRQSGLSSVQVCVRTRLRTVSSATLWNLDILSL